MKICLILPLLMGCSIPLDYDVKGPISKINNDAYSLMENCAKIGICLKSSARIVHFSNQKHAPYACSIRTFLGEIYLYPDASFGFGDIGDTRYENALSVCELATHTGEWSRSSILKRKKQMAIWEENNKKKPLEPVKKILLPIEESQ